MKKAGDVIPRVEAPVVHLRTGGETPPASSPTSPRTESDATRPAAAAGADTGSVDGLPLAGMSVVTGAMTGDLADLSRNQMNELIERAGGKASSSVSARTSLVVVGERCAIGRPRNAEIDWPDQDR